MKYIYGKLLATLLSGYCSFYCMDPAQKEQVRMDLLYTLYKQHTQKTVLKNFSFLYSLAQGNESLRTELKTLYKAINQGNNNIQPQLDSFCVEWGLEPVSVADACQHQWAS